MNFFILSDVLARTWFLLGGWEELGPTKIYEVLFWRVLMVEVPCTSFFFSFLFFFFFFFSHKF